VDIAIPLLQSHVSLIAQQFAHPTTVPCEILYRVRVKVDNLGMSQDEGSIIRWHSGLGTFYQGPWRFAHVFRAISTNHHILHLLLPSSGSTMGLSEVSTSSNRFPSRITNLLIEYPRDLWSIQEAPNARPAAAAPSQPEKIHESSSTGDSQDIQNNEFAWTFARDDLAEHVKKINHGASGEVHMVYNVVSDILICRCETKRRTR
jgi:hypothetical protein